MNTSTKWIATAATAVAIFFGSNVKAQTTSDSPWRLGIGVEAGVPTGNRSDFSKFELGGTARLQYDTKSNLSFMLTSGYYNMFAKDQTIGNVTYKFNDAGMIPVKAGLKAFATQNIYFSGEVGAGFETNYAKNTKLIVSPGLVYASKSGLDIGVRYENFSGADDNYGIVGLRLAYGFKL